MLRDEEAAGSNPVTPTSSTAGQSPVPCSGSIATAPVRITRFAATFGLVPAPERTERQTSMPAVAARRSSQRALLVPVRPIRTCGPICSAGGAAISTVAPEPVDAQDGRIVVKNVASDLEDEIS